MKDLCLFLLQSPAMQDSLGGKETSDDLVRGASIILLTVSIAAWFFAWKFFSIEKKGRKYFFINLAAALFYLPFLVRFFFYCYDMDFSTGKEHYLMLFFVHSGIAAFWGLGFYGKHKEEEAL